MKRIGIPVVIDGDAWHGGNNYFLSLLDVLSEHCPADLQFFMLTNRSDLFDKPYSDQVQVRQCDQLTCISDRTRRLSRHFQTDIRLAYYARQYQLDLLTHAMPGTRLVPPTVYWMPDFQHCHLPQLFQPAELQTRDRNIAMAAERSGHLMLSSQAAATDFQTFFPQYSAVQTHVVHFSPFILEQDFSLFRQTLQQPEQEAAFFYLPNQFWTHKNHLLVLDALTKLPNDIKVICTGNPDDYRNKNHMDDIRARISRDGLEERFIIRGLVSRSEIIRLMAGSVAVINPSLFEGWSTTIEEAKAFGKTVLLSDIPVHREQAPKSASYFPPQHSDALAAVMLQTWQQRATLHQSELAGLDAARQRYQLARQDFANRYIAMVRAMLRTTPHRSHNL